MCSKFKSIRIKDGETVDDFAMQLTSLVNNLRILSDNINDKRVIKKFLYIVPPKYIQATISIKAVVNLKKLTMEKLTRWLKVIKEHYELGIDSNSMDSKLSSLRKSSSYTKKRENSTRVLLVERKKVAVVVTTIVLLSNVVMDAAQQQEAMT